MVYKQKFVAAVKVAGKVLRELDESVTLPFGSEYSLLLKNLDSVRVKVNVEIDGRKAIKDLVLGPNQSCDVERFLIDNLNAGNKFKFIERTESIENHRGIKAEDGLILVEFAREKVTKHEYTDVYHHNVHHYDWYTYPRYTWLGQSYGGNIFNCYSGPLKSVGQVDTTATCSLDSTFCGNVQMAAQNTMQMNDAGITVEGGVSNQQFYTTTNFQTFDPEVVVLKLRGKVGEKAVSKPITVKTKIECHTCGKYSLCGERFCSNCGTGLEIIG